jgi:multicomponent Na+:H+ antiporter subunit D
MIKIWNEAFLKKGEAESKTKKLTLGEALPSVILGLISIMMGIFAAPVFDFASEAAEVLLENTKYIEGVLK